MGTFLLRQWQDGVGYLLHLQSSQMFLGGPVLILTPGEFAEPVSLVYFVEKGEVKVIYSLCIF